MRDGHNEWNGGWNLDAERSLWASICAPNHWFNEETGEAEDTHSESLWWFIHLAWGAEFYFRARPGQSRWLQKRVHGPYLGWLQKNILDWKQSRKEGKHARWYVAIIMTRSFGKTVTATKCASLWAHLDEPDMSTLLCSAVSDLTVDILKSIQTVVSGKDTEQSWFCWLYGNWRDPQREWKQQYCHHAYRKTASISEPSFDTTAVDIGMTGYHPDWVQWDDPITKNKLRDGGSYLESVHSAFNATYPALKMDGWLGMVLTRYLDDDVAGRHLREDGVKTWDGMECPHQFIFERVNLGEGVWRVYYLQGVDELTDVPTIPEILNADEIRRWKKRDPEDFACQVQNNPGSGEHAPLNEEQVRDLFVDYKLLRSDLPVLDATVHIDTAFKDLETIRSGDDSAIVVFFHDIRSNGIVYLHTDLVRASNTWRSEEFSDQLIEVLKLLRRELYTVRAITDEKEVGGKIGVYKQNLIATIRGAKLSVPRIVQFQRQGTRKIERIRKAAGYWQEGYVRILLHKDFRGEWIIPPMTRKLINQIIRIDAVKQKDLADAAADVFQPGIWRKPTFDPWEGEGKFEAMQPGDEALKNIGKPFSDDEIRDILDGKMQNPYETEEWSPVGQQ